MRTAFAFLSLHSLAHCPTFSHLADSDPRAGTPPSLLTNTAILTSVSLYYLTHTFLSSVWIYASNPQGFATVYTKAATNAPLLFSLFEYNIAFWPEEYVEEVGNLVDYRGAFPFRSLFGEEDLRWRYLRVMFSARFRGTFCGIGQPAGSY